MSVEQVLLLAILAASVAMFLWGGWRHDMVAVAALLISVIVGVVAPADAFAGFGHPAVITVACVLVLSRALQTSGAVDVAARHLLPATAGPTLSIAALTALAALLSAFMNNVGALALLLPVATQIARRLELPAGRVLMPLAFGSILGGMTTLIGTPPNLIVSSFRHELGGENFSMFDFTPVGLAVASIAVGFVALVGWRLVPVRKHASNEGFDTGAYITEARIPKGSGSAGKTVGEIGLLLDSFDAQLLGFVRHDIRINAPSARRRLHVGDILMIEAEAERLAPTLAELGLVLAEAGDREAEPKGSAVGEDAVDAASDEQVLMELAVLPGSPLISRSASDILLRSRYGINLLAVSRQGRRSTARLRTMPMQAGDLLLMQGVEEGLVEFASQSGCVPLAERELRIPDRRKALTAVAVLVAAITTAAFGVLPAAVAFAAGVLASMVLRTLPPRSVYEAIDWPVIVLLAALIPVAGAMETTGSADLIARFLLEGVAQGHPVLALSLVLVVTMTLSDLVNNAATAAIMCPIAIGTASALGVNPDAFLMAVAIGASCAFLTPIGHQNNTLILGPGGFRFGDYWPLGLPVQLIVIAVALPMLLRVWPL